VCSWLSWSLIIPSAINQGTSPANQAKLVKMQRSAGRTILTSLACLLLTGGLTADGMISRTGVSGADEREPTRSPCN
jgi:hypothetical protein